MEAALKSAAILVKFTGCVHGQENILDKKSLKSNWRGMKFTQDATGYDIELII